MKIKQTDVILRTGGDSTIPTTSKPKVFSLCAARLRGVTINIGDTTQKHEPCQGTIIFSCYIPSTYHYRRRRDYFFFFVK